MESELSKTAKIGVRLTQQELDLIKSAAERMGCSLSSFVVCAAYKAAQYTIQQNDSIELSTEDQMRFAHALLVPADHSPALRRASEAHSRLVEPGSPMPLSKLE